MGNTKLTRNIELLIQIMNTKGVQPSDLVDNIFIEEYSSLNFSKKKGHIYGQIEYIERHGQINIPVVLVYKYNEKKEVIKITETIDGLSTVVWDRGSKETDLINEILALASIELSALDFTKFVDSLPETLAKKIKAAGKRIA